MEKKNDPRPRHPRHPYTYAADLLRMIPARDGMSCKLSRSDASQIRSTICEICGLDDREVAEKLADYFLENQNILQDKALEDVKSTFYRETKYDV